MGDPEALAIRVDALQTQLERVKRKLARTLDDLAEARADAAHWQARAEAAERNLAFAALRQIDASEAGRVISASFWRDPARLAARQETADKLVAAWHMVVRDGVTRAEAGRRLGLARPALSDFFSMRRPSAVTDLAWSILEADPASGAKRPQPANPEVLRRKRQG